MRRPASATFIGLDLAYNKFCGAIVNLRERPQVGQHINVGDLEVEVLEVIDLIPPRGDFHFLHATCRAVPPKENA